MVCIFPHSEGQRYSYTNIQYKCEKIRTRITPKTDTFYAVRETEIIFSDNIFKYITQARNCLKLLYETHSCLEGLVL